MTVVDGSCDEVGYVSCERGCEAARLQVQIEVSGIVIKVPEGAVLRGCKKTRRKLREHLRLRAEIHSQLRLIASLFVLGYPTPGFPSAPPPPAVQPPQPTDAPPLPPLPPRAPAQPAPVQPASMEFDTDSDSESDCDSEPEPQSDSESESEPEPVTQPLPRRCSARLAALAPAAPTGPPLPLDCEDPGALPAKGKEYPGLGYKRLRDKPPKAQEQQQQPAEFRNDVM
ncbi:hypothetical protein V8C86DRAFT_3146586 [Haematococcus lacustris]